jgi:hypothetical protein
MALGSRSKNFYRRFSRLSEQAFQRPTYGVGGIPKGLILIGNYLVEHRKGNRVVEHHHSSEWGRAGQIFGTFPEVYHVAAELFRGPTPFL